MTRRLLLVLAAGLLAGCQAAAGAGLPSATVVPAPVASSSDSTPSAVSPSSAFVSGLTVPWAVGGRRAERTGRITYFAGEWPAFRVPAVRLWDTYTTWAHLEPAPGQWHLWRLDGLVEKARAHGTTDITLVLASTPRWAATRVRSVDAPWIGPGSASPPLSIGSWRSYVTAVATRYRGRITSYEIGNEPNLRMFWNGTPEQYGELVAVAAPAIRAADPSATIVANVGVVQRERDVRRLARWIAPVVAVPGVDVISVHAYPKVDALASSGRLLARTFGAVTRADALDRPVWVTEVNVTDGSSLRRHRQRAVVAALDASIASAGYARSYWYAWTDLGPANLIQLHTGTPGERALAGVP